MKLKEKLNKIIISLILVILLFPYGIVSAASIAFSVKEVSNNNQILIAQESSTTIKTPTAESIYYDKGFVYQGVGTISSFNVQTFGDWIIDLLGDILDYLIGIMTLGIKIVAIGWTTIIERTVIDGIVNDVTGVGKASSTQTEDGSPVKLDTSSKTNVTVESIVYNRVPILDANFFNRDTAQISKSTNLANQTPTVETVDLDKEGVVYLIKENIAIWYFTIRLFVIAVMLLILIYLGIRLAIGSVGSQKAVYKEMLIGWITGFILIFVMHYIMYFILISNETLVNIISPTTARGTEISLYESVRSKAYEIKASSGLVGTLLYMILVYYAIKFLIVYLKRYFTIIILAIISPIVAMSYSVEKINKKGKVKSEIYGNWLKDFTFTVFLQTIHALIYRVFVENVLELSEISFAGIVLSLVCINFMLKAEKILRKIFNFNNGKNTNDLMESAIPNLFAAKIAGVSLSKVAVSYAKGVNHFIPVTKGAYALYNKAADKIEHTDTKKREAVTNIDKKLEKEKEKRRKERDKQVKNILSASKDIIGGTAALLVATPMVIADSSVGAFAMIKSLSNIIQGNFNFRDIKGYYRQSANDKKKYKVKGFKILNKKNRKKFIQYLMANGINYTIVEYGENTIQGNMFGRHIINNAAATNLGLARQSSPRIERINQLNEAAIKEEALIREYDRVMADKLKILDTVKLLDPDKAEEQKEEVIKNFEMNIKKILKPLADEELFDVLDQYHKENENDTKITDSSVESIVEKLNKKLKEKGSDVKLNSSFEEEFKKVITKTSNEKDNIINTENSIEKLKQQGVEKVVEGLNKGGSSATGSLDPDNKR